MKKILTFLIALLSLPVSALAAGDAELYDPTIPADSAFVRVINASGEKASAEVAGLAFADLASPSASEYFIVKQGDYKASFQGKDAPLKVAAGKSYSVALLPGGASTVLEDAAIVNPTKSGVYFYNLSDGAASLHAPEFKADIAANQAAGTSSMREVNALEVGLTVLAGGKEAATFDKITLKRRTGTSFIFAGSSGAYKALAVENSIKRN